MTPTFPLFMTMILILFTAPLSADEGVGRAQGNPLQCVSASSQNIEITVHYLDEQERIDLVGGKNNPFLDWGGTPLTVFKVTVENTPTTIRFFTNTIELKIGDVVLRGTFPESYITQFWENKLRNYSGNFDGHRRRYTSWSGGGVAYNVRKYMLHNREKVKPGEEFEKLVVFEGKLPGSGTVELMLPVYDDAGTLIHPFRFVYQE